MSGNTRITIANMLSANTFQYFTQAYANNMIASMAPLAFSTATSSPVCPALALETNTPPTLDVTSGGIAGARGAHQVAQQAAPRRPSADYHGVAGPRARRRPWNDAGPSSAALVGRRFLC